MEDYFSKLETKIAKNPDFNKEEIEVLRSVISVYRGLVSLKVVGSWIVVVLMSVSGALLAWETITERFKG